MSDFKLLQDGDPSPFRIENPDADSRFVVICDHAGQSFPARLGQLGIRDEDRQKHITYDIGTEEVGLYLGEKLNAVTFIAHYSRLVADVNRDPFRFDFVPEVSDHIPVPGNKDMSAKELRARINEIYKPYQFALGDCLQSFLDRGDAPFLLSIHSFTPEMDGHKRPWEIGILWTDEDRAAPPMLDALRKNNPGLTIGDNAPYSLKLHGGRDYSNTVELQARARGIPSLVVEFRQDTVDTPEKAVKMADIFLESLLEVMRDEDLYRLSA
ncbi:MAG: hypothetical protein EP349_08700 [Alphaproteobacteria bacterium]|nr:MAG: hypothetical protein EP349_08700 [Alphaproteobacteria bacterium]